MRREYMQTLYLECQNGISGDMVVAALLDLGADQKVLEQALESLPVGGFEIVVSRVKRAGLDMCDFDVRLDAAHENHDHDMEYLYGHSCQEKEQPYGHEHGHRNLEEILQIIDQANMSDTAKRTAIRIFEILAEAEAKAHGVPKEEVHFHEVGAIDSIVDIVSVAVCFDNLHIKDTVIPFLNEGQGSIRCQHGILPIPVPAVVNIAADFELPLHITETKGELVTPTGAAIAAAVCTLRTLPSVFSIQKVGMGAGKRNYERPSFLRAMLIYPQGKEKDCIYKLETNIDDCSGEQLGYTMDRLMEAGARDVHFVPVFMKKNRPAFQLNVICAETDIDRMEQIIFEETTTIGIRKIAMERTILEREIISLQTILGEAKVKICTYHGRKQCFPEYNSVVHLCKLHEKNFQEVYQIIQETWKNTNNF